MEKEWRENTATDYKIYSSSPPCILEINYFSILEGNLRSSQVSIVSDLLDHMLLNIIEICYATFVFQSISEEKNIFIDTKLV